MEFNRQEELVHRNNLRHWNCPQRESAYCNVDSLQCGQSVVRGKWSLMWESCGVQGVLYSETFDTVGMLTGRIKWKGEN